MKRKKIARIFLNTAFVSKFMKYAEKSFEMIAKNIRSYSWDFLALTNVFSSDSTESLNFSVWKRKSKLN